MPSTIVPATVASPELSPTEVVFGPRNQPNLVHSLRHGSTILALAVCAEYGFIYAGTQDGEIVVWSLATFHQVHKIQAHKRSVLSLYFSPDASLLFSSAGDPIISAWDPKTLRRVYEIYGVHDVGDIFCTAYSPQHETLYIGAQNATIQWVALNDPSVRVNTENDKHPDRRNHRFFDSKPVGGTSTPRRNDDRWQLIPRAQHTLQIEDTALCNFAHNGYVYCMLIAKGPTVQVGADDEVLVSGGGDGTIKVWSLGKTQRSQALEEPADHGAIEEIMTLGSDDAESVLSLAIDGSFLYSGKLDGIVELWDLDTAQKLRVIKAHDRDVMSLQMGWGSLWTASRDGWVSQYSTAHYGQYQHASGNVSEKYQCLSNWKAHEAKILASTVTTFKDNRFFISGSNDDSTSIWSVKCHVSDKSRPSYDEDAFLSSLRDFVSYKTVSSRPQFAEDCRKGATFLGALFKRLGGQVEMLSTETAHNPVVCAKFSGNRESTENRKRILFYGHYDVVAADNSKGKWGADPFTLTGTNGFLYGRGVSDNKGPTLAALYAVSDLIQAKKLLNDVIFLIEGEEEYGSRGFEACVRRNKELIGDVDYILLANSYWLDDEVPCLTYGLRGVLHATVSVDSPGPDIHSGVDGSYMRDEPLSDLTVVLSKLKGPGNRVQIPNFYDGVPAVTPEEEARYDAIASMLMRRNANGVSEDKLKRSLMARWREPNVTIHRYKVSGPEGSLVSSQAKSHISLRLVPGQDTDVVVRELTTFVNREFAALGSENWLSINIDNTAEPWLGDPSNKIFQTLEQAIVETWPGCFESAGSPDASASAAQQEATTAATSKSTKPKRPLYIREGGSIPAIRFLEKEFGAPAAHLPCGQASDSAHLDNERMSVTNILKAREIFAKVFGRL